MSAPPPVGVRGPVRVPGRLAGWRRPPDGSEGTLLRRTRLRLIAWSAGSTLVVLVVLGAAIYLATAASLAAASTDHLRSRLAELVAGVGRASLAPVSIAGGTGAMSTIGVTSDPATPGILVGGDASGTIAFIVGAGPLPAGLEAHPSGVATSGSGTSGSGTSGLGPTTAGAAPVVVDATATGGGPAGGLPLGAGTVSLVADPGLLEEALAHGTVVRETTIDGAPARVLASSVADGANRVVAVVIDDRRAELATLATLLAVLLGGGLLVLAASVALGAVYAGRALVPIRESLRRQREFAADASHELRTPLAISRAAIAELRRGRTDPAVVDRALDDLDAGATRLEALVDDLLLLARTDAGAVDLDLAETDLALAAAEACETLEPLAAARGVRLGVDVVPSPLRGDEARLRQLAAILLDNAIRHAPDGSRVTLTVRPGARLVVEDEGRGIDPAHREVVFERFWRAPDAPAGGTGLGLAIARWIAERHGGSIHAEGRGDRPGARFVVQLAAG